MGQKDRLVHLVDLVTEDNPVFLDSLEIPVGQVVLAVLGLKDLVDTLALLVRMDSLVHLVSLDILA